MFVPCGKCDDCLIEKSNIKAVELSQYMSNFPYKMMVTLTYDNWHLPCIIPDDMKVDCDGVITPMSKNIYRRIGFCNREKIDEFDEPIKFELYQPKKVKENLTGILYYKDVQKFLKLFRYYYVKPIVKYHHGRKFRKLFSCSEGQLRRACENERNFKVFVCAEYGTRSHRPHYHILFLSEVPFRRRFQNHIVSNWQMCDWSELKLHFDKYGKSAFEKSFEQIFDSKCSRYVSSYVNCYSDGNQFFSQRRIRPKTYRSKDITFTLSKEISEAFKSFLTDFRPSKHLFEGVSRPFEQVYTTSDGCVSSRILPARILYAYIRKPKDCFRCGIDIFRKKCISVIRRYFFGKRESVDSTDYLFILAFRRYCDLVGANIHCESVWLVYIDLCFRVLGLYESEKLRLQMMSFSKSNWVNYLLSLNQTSIDDPNLRLELWSNFLFTAHIDIDKDFLLSFLGMCLSFEMYNKSRRRVEKYRSYLVGKHCKEFNRLRSNFINF